MIICFTPNGKVTRETCPVCQTPNVKVEHGRRTRLDSDDKPHDLGPAHYWHCPECGDATVIVACDCPLCSAEPEGGTPVLA